jgi:hypothetical protein
MPFELFSFREAYKPEAQFPKSSVRNCPKSLGRAYNVALRDTQTVLFGSFWPPYTLQIYARSDAHTPFSKAAKYLGCESIKAFEKIATREGIPKHYLSARTPRYNRTELDP